MLLCDMNSRTANADGNFYSDHNIDNNDHNLNTELQ